MEWFVPFVVELPRVDVEDVSLFRIAVCRVSVGIGDSIAGAALLRDKGSEWRRRRRKSKGVKWKKRKKRRRYLHRCMNRRVRARVRGRKRSKSRTMASWYQRGVSF